MPVSGEWTVNGSATGFRELSVKLKTVGEVGLRREMSKAITTATKPAKDAVRAEIIAAMPKAGGANQRLAANAGIRTNVLTGVNSAGVRIRARRKGRDWDSINRGRLRHPVYGHRDRWADTDVPAGWWEKALAPFGPEVQVALLAAMRRAAWSAGFVVR